MRCRAVVLRIRWAMPTLRLLKHTQVPLLRKSGVVLLIGAIAQEILIHIIRFG